MSYKKLEDCLSDLESRKDLLRIKEEVDPNLQIADIHLEHFKNSQKSILFENVKGTKYRAVSNIFGTKKRIDYIFRDKISIVKDLISLKTNPKSLLKNPFRSLKTILNSYYALPMKVPFPKDFEEVSICDLPQIKCWPMDGGAFITLPQVYSQEYGKGIFSSNLGMYRIQLSGNDYILNEEIGLHYQIHRGIGIHQLKAKNNGENLKVSIFVGGPPAHTVSAVMPLPEGMPEVCFAGVLSGRRFRYSIIDGYTISSDADFVICGELVNDELKKEGPFGDHLGYYSLQHDFPFMRVERVFAKKNGIWPFTVVGRPPQEDSQFGSFIHDLTDKAVESEIPGLISINAVDEAGVHPLLLAIGSERYTPYNKIERPQEILTIANHILGTGQMSLAKYLFICNNDDNVPSIKDVKSYFLYFLKIVDWERDLHFYTNTTIDTLDYSGTKLNEGSKVVIAAAGKEKRKLVSKLSEDIMSDIILEASFVIEGILAIRSNDDMIHIIQDLEKNEFLGISLIVVVDDVKFVSNDFSNWLWVTFTRSDPARDIFGINSKISKKHFSCSVPVIDARIKEYHAPVLERD